MKKRYLTLILSGSVVALMSSCGGESEQPAPPQEEQTVIRPAEPLGFGDEGSQSYSIPSPNELFSIIKESKLPYKEGLINTESTNYSTSKTQALNFGRLTADIAYTASYEKFQESMANFDNLRKIGDDLGISYVFDEFIVNRVKDNMDNADSLEVISTSSYQRIIGMLEENEKASTLAIIAAGGFAESIYLLTHLIGDYSENSEVIYRLADEKLVLENIIDYLLLYNDEERVQEVLTEMQEMSSVFMGLSEEKVSEEKTVKGDKVVLGGSRVNMTAEEFKALKEAATTFRNSFANASQS